MTREELLAALTVERFAPRPTSAPAAESGVDPHAASHRAVLAAATRPDTNVVHLAERRAG